MIDIANWGAFQWLVLLYVALDWGVTANSRKARQRLNEQVAKAKYHPAIVTVSLVVGCGINAFILLALLIAGGFFR